MENKRSRCRQNNKIRQASQCLNPSLVWLRTPRKDAPPFPRRLSQKYTKTGTRHQQKTYLLFLSGCKSKDSFRHAFLISDCDAERFTFCGLGGREGGGEGVH